MWEFLRVAAHQLRSGWPTQRYMQQFEKQVMSIDDDGIVRVKVADGAVYQLEDAREAIAHIRTAYGQTRHPVLVDITGIHSISREARAYFSGPETREVESACALVVGSPLSRAFGNFFLGFNRKSYPIRLFTRIDDAAAWLRSFTGNA